MSGDAVTAKTMFAEVVREAPTYAKAQYSLGVLLAMQDEDEQAAARLSAAIALEPNYVEAHVSLAELSRKRGRLQEAVSHYDRALAADSRLPEAALGRALTLIRLERYGEAIDRLREARQGHPASPWLAHALARLLAAAPDDRLRDGRQALGVMTALTPNDQRLDFGETMSMVLAEVGRYEEAAAWQRAAIELARRAGQAEQTARMTERLELYAAGRPSRRPWRPEELK
jgi:tetratricopeptide (TPR) repeat protein